MELFGGLWMQKNQETFYVCRHWSSSMGNFKQIIRLLETIFERFLGHQR
jgi:hypothetical protein